MFYDVSISHDLADESLIVAQVKFEPESSSSHESSSSQFSFYLFFLNTVELYCKYYHQKCQIGKINISSLLFNWRSFQLETYSFVPFLDFKHTPA